MNTPIFEVKNLCKSYKKKKPILKDLNFKISRNELCCILGNNGTGKTTLINCFIKLLKINSGEILYNGRSIDKIHDREYYKEVVAVLEGTRNVYWYLTAMQNITYFGKQKGLSKKQILKKANELLHIFDLYDNRNELAGDYSRGMSQKLSIIITLLTEPKVIFLDEPTLGLDVVSKRRVMEILKDLSSRVTIILTSHQLDVVEAVAENLILIEQGKISYTGKTQEFKHEYQGKKYIISTLHADSILNKVGSGITVNSQGEITNFTFPDTELSTLENFLYLLRVNNVELLSVKKESSSLEDIMYNLSNGK